MKKSLFVLFILSLASHSIVRGDSITGSLGNAPLSLDLNDYDAFAYYGDTSAVLFTNTPGTPSTDLLNLANFSNLKPTTGFTIATSGVSPAVVSYANGTATPQSSAANSGDFYFAKGTANGNGAGFSLTTTLFAPEETFQFLLQGYDTEMDLTASLNDSSTTSFSLTNAILADPWSGGTATASGNSYGLLTLVVDGTVGQTLTFSDLAANGVGTYNNVGIEAVTVEAPEPAAYALMFIGMVFLGFYLRRQKNGLRA